MTLLFDTGIEWVVDASGCDPERLRSRDAIAAVFHAIVHDLGLTIVGEPQWHVFPGAAGVTGLALLSESHIACHTFPERGFAAFNLYCCRVRPDWRWDVALRTALGAERVTVRRLVRGTSAESLALESLSGHASSG